MPIDVRQFASTPEGRLAQRLADIERQLGMLHRGHIRNRQYAEQLGEVGTTLAGPVDLGGPSITVNALAGSFVAVYAQAEVSTDGVATASVYVYEPTDLPSGEQIMQNSGIPAYQARRTAPGLSVGVITTPSGQITFVPTPGTRTYSLRYSGAGGTGFFRNRRLWVEVI